MSRLLFQNDQNTQKMPSVEFYGCRTMSHPLQVDAEYLQHVNVEIGPGLLSSVGREKRGGLSVL